MNEDKAAMTEPLDDPGRVTPAQAIAAECRKRMQHGENYVKSESGLFLFTIAPHHLNILLSAVDELKVSPSHSGAQ